MERVGIISKMETTTHKGEQMIPKGYKHTELGVLPKDWEVVRLGDVCEIQSGGTPSRNVKKYWENGAIKWLGSSVCKNQNRIDEITDYITEEGLKNSSAKIFSKGTTLIALVGATIGKVAYLPFEASTNQNIAGLQPNKQVANDKFIFYSSLMLYRHFETLSSDKFKMANLSFVRNLQIPLPPLAEQEKIAEILSTWDTQIQNFETLITEKQALKKGLCQTLLTAKTRLKGFSGDWEVVRLGDIAEDEDFKRIPVSLVEREKLTKDGGVTYPYYGAMGQVGWINDYIFDEERILLAEDGCPFLEKDKQKSFIAKGKYWVNNHAHILKFDLSKGNNYFLCNQLNRVDYAKYVNGVERLKLNKEVMKEIKILIPSLAEQEKIAEILSEGDKEIMLLEQKLESLKSQKRGLMQNLLNGKVRIRQ